MGSNQMFSVLLFALTVYHTKGCQGPWDLLVDSKHLNENSMVRYKNVTTIGKKEWLSFSWKGDEHEIWNLDLLFLLKRDRMEGKIRYTKIPDEEVIIPWVIENKQINSMINSKKIFSKPWTFLLCDRLEISFSTDDGGNWEIRIGEFLLQRTPQDENEHTIQKRSEEFYGERNMTGYQPSGGGFDFMDSIYDYFFGDEDPATGRKAGIFSRMKTWMRDMACRLGIACEGAGPQPPYFPMPPAPPPAEPDAETITEDNIHNDVYQK